VIAFEDNIAVSGRIFWDFIDDPGTRVTNIDGSTLRVGQGRQSGFHRQIPQGGTITVIHLQDAPDQLITPWKERAPRTGTPAILDSVEPNEHLDFAWVSSEVPS